VSASNRQDDPFRPIPAGIRGFKGERCPRCWMAAGACVCDLIASLPTRTRVIIVMPWKESARSSNTGRLAHLALPNSEIRLRGRPGQPMDLSDLTSAERGLLLYPADDARELVPADAAGAPACLVVPDGTWRQAKRVVKHERALSGFERVRLPPGPPSGYRLRQPRKPGWLCTYEAIGRALDLLEGGPVADALWPAFEQMVARTLAERGRAAGG
jgi:DTW domain-containing protein YfiP